jgi:hypothetical protein
MAHSGCGVGAYAFSVIPNITLKTATMASATNNLRVGFNFILSPPLPSVGFLFDARFWIS